MSANPRRTALNSIVGIQPRATSDSFLDQSLTDLFGINVFGDRAMRERLPEAAYDSLRETIETGKPLDAEIADLVANAMKEWAVERGATHFTHWFQPMTGLTAEKHDSFLKFSSKGILLEFSGRELIKGEPDASSFPSGGLRSTFEARGYTAWDPTSPAFIREGVNGALLCIPTAFCSWTGEALDKKTPLLRSEHALSRAAVELLHLLGDEETRAVWSTAGPEQEFFLIDRNYFLARPDLVATGRTLLGARPPKGQELEDHYFGSMPPRILACLQEVERELWKLGVPLKTRHNEVAPSQYELAPIYERSTLASDHNMLAMEILRQVAQRHGLVCLLHEKPFAGINGSGKHNNWSMQTSQGENLLEPGHTPAENARFMLVLTAVIRAVDLHADLLRISVARAGNDHRLGANEAPPAIISIYLGDELDRICRTLMGEDLPEAAGLARNMELGVSSLPPLPRDLTDRNRTSPFAFTGNKFEFRAVGASQSVADCNKVLNTIVAESLQHLRNELEKRMAETTLEKAIQDVVRENLRSHYRVVFNGNNYSEEWVREAERRGLANLRNTPEAIAMYASEKNVALFESQGVLTRTEVESRGTIMYETYAKAIAIEAQACLSIATTCVLPSAIRQQEEMARSLSLTRENTDLDVSAQEELLGRLTSLVNELIIANRELQISQEEAERKVEDHAGKAAFYRDEVLPAMARVRTACDELETIVDDAAWTLPRYSEMLFVH